MTKWLRKPEQSPMAKAALRQKHIESHAMGKSLGNNRFCLNIETLRHNFFIFHQYVPSIYTVNTLPGGFGNPLIACSRLKRHERKYAGSSGFREVAE